MQTGRNGSAMSEKQTGSNVVPVGRCRDRSRPLTGDGWEMGYRDDVACRGLMVNERYKSAIGN